MTERDALYAAVLAEPEADAPRLVYADWLEEHPRGPADAARATFIRLEIEAAGLPAESEARSRVQTAADKLFNQYGGRWNDELPAWAEWPESTLIYRRGFPAELRTAFQTIVARNDHLFEQAPIRALGVGVGARPFTVNVLGGLLSVGPDLRRIRALTVGPSLDLGVTGEVARLAFHTAAGYESLKDLHRLSFAGNGITDDTAALLAEALAGAVFRDSLEELDLSDNVIRAVGAIRLSVAPTLPRLRRLVLTGNPLTDDGRLMLRNHFGDRVVF